MVLFNQAQMVRQVDLVVVVLIVVVLVGQEIHLVLPQLKDLLVVITTTLGVLVPVVVVHQPQAQITLKALPALAEQELQIVIELIQQ